MSEEELKAKLEQEYAKYIEACRASGAAARQNASALELSHLILQERHQAGRLEIIRELLSAGVVA